MLRLACSTTLHHIPVALDLQQHCCDNLKPSSLSQQNFNTKEHRLMGKKICWQHCSYICIVIEILLWLEHANDGTAQKMCSVAGGERNIFSFYLVIKCKMSVNNHWWIYVGGLISFASTVIFLFTLDISGWNRFCVVAWYLSSIILHLERTDAYILTSAHRNWRVFRCSVQKACC